MPFDNPETRVDSRRRDRLARDVKTLEALVLRFPRYQPSLQMMRDNLAECDHVLATYLIPSLENGG